MRRAVSRAQCSMSSECTFYSVCARVDCAAHDALQNRDRTKLQPVVGAGFKPAPTTQIRACGGPGSAVHRDAAMNYA